MTLALGLLVMAISLSLTFVKIAGADPVPSAGSILLSGASAVRFSPPTLADLNGDGKLEILVGTYDGKVYALKYSNTAPYLSVLWSHSTSSDLGCATSIHGAISVGDLDGNGSVEVVVPVGEINTNTCGGLVVLNGQTGALKWLYRTYDTMINATGLAGSDGLSDPVVSTPALGDLDNDGKLEIVFGGLDQRIYALRSDGTMMTGWPKFVRDTVISSPALADIDNDGFLEVIIGGDTHLEGAPFNTQNGGVLYVYRWDGSTMPGFPKYIGQSIWSSPAIGDLNGDGNLDIVSGTGEVYSNPTDGFAVYAWDKSGTQLWKATTGGNVFGSPALGDLNGDGKLEVVVGARDNKLYAWNHDGTVLWNLTPTNFQGNVAPLGSPIIAISNSVDAHPNAFVNLLWDSVIVNGQNGTQLTPNHFPGDSRGAFVGGCTTQDNVPAIGDIDGDGKLELILASGNNVGSNCGTALVNFWRLSSSAPSDLGNTTTTPWPMFGQNAQHTRVYPQRGTWDAEVVSHTIPDVMAPGEIKQVSITLRNTGLNAWTASGQVRLGAVGDSDPFTTGTRVNLNSGESIGLGQTRTFSFVLQAPTVQGYYTTDWRMVDDAMGKWFGRTVRVNIKVGNQPALQVLTTQGIYQGGLSTTALSTPRWPTGFWNWASAQLWKITADKQGYYLLDTYGGNWTGGNAMPLAAAGNVSGLEDMVLGPDQVSYYELLSNGTIDGCDNSGCNRTFNPAVPTGIAARSLALTSDGKGVYVVDGAGNLFRGGTATAMSLPTGLPVTTGDTDIIRRIKMAPNGTGYYLMDKYGRIWNGGGAPALTLGYSPHIGEDWARDFALTSDGTGFYLLAKNSAIYSGGTAPQLTLNIPPTFAGDVARGLALMDSRVPASPAPSGSQYLLYLPLVIK